MENHSSTSSTSTSEEVTSDITMLPDLPPGSNERLRAPLDFPDDVELDDIEVFVTDFVLSPNELDAAHYHPGQNFLYVLEGSAEFKVDGEPDEIVEAGGAKDIPYERKHSARGTEEGARIVGFSVHEEDRPERFSVEDHEHEEDHEHGDENTGFISEAQGLQIEGSDGDDRINGSDGNDIINSGNGDDTISSGAGDDTINGGRGLDILDGGAGTDVLALFALNRGDENIDFVGEADNFTFFVDGADEGTFLNIESVEFDNGEVVSTQDLDFNDAIADSEGLQIEGSDGNDTIDGSDGNDIINSGDGDDTISSGAGDDTINGGRGLDLLDGGAGTDVLALFALNRGDENIGFVGEADNFTFFVDGADEGTFLNIESVEFDNGEVVSTQDLDFKDAIADSEGLQIEGSMLPELPSSSNEILRSPLESPEDIDDIEVIISDVVVPPNGALPLHYHPGEEFVYVLQGSTIHDVDGQPLEILEAGDGRVIPYERKHEPVATDEGARVLVFRVHEEGEPERFLVEDHEHEHGDDPAGANFATIDLTDSADRTVEFTVSRDAAFDNTIGFYEVNGDGSVQDPVSGQTIAIGKEGYQDAALANSLDFTLSTGDGDSTFTTDLAGGTQYGTFIIANGGLDELLDEDSSNDPPIYFDAAGNASGFDRIRTSGSNTFEYEDLTYGTDGVLNDGTPDYNDMVVEYSFV